MQVSDHAKTHANDNGPLSRLRRSYIVNKVEWIPPVMAIQFRPDIKEQFQFKVRPRLPCLKYSQCFRVYGSVRRCTVAKGLILLLTSCVWL